MNSTNNQRGVAMVELLIVAPLLILIIFSTINFCFAAYNQWYFVSTVLPETASMVDETNSLGELRYRAAELLMKGEFRVSDYALNFTADSGTKIITLQFSVQYLFPISVPGWPGINFTETVYTKYTE